MFEVVYNLVNFLNIVKYFTVILINHNRNKKTVLIIIFNNLNLYLIILT